MAEQLATQLDGTLKLDDTASPQPVNTPTKPNPIPGGWMTMEETKTLIEHGALGDGAKVTNLKWYGFGENRKLRIHVQIDDEQKIYPIRAIVVDDRTLISKRSFDIFSKRATAKVSKDIELLKS